MARYYVAGAGFVKADILAESRHIPHGVIFDPGE
jgi:hypothetical protein